MIKKCFALIEFSIFLAGIISAWSGSAYPLSQLPQQNAATKLVELAQFDRMAKVVLARSLFPRAKPDDAQFLSFFHCAEKSSSKPFLQVLSKAATENWTAEELDTALKFYELPNGQKLAQAQLASVYAALGLANEHPLPPLTSDERASIERLASTAIGPKIRLEYLMMAPGIQNNLHEAGRISFDRCAG